MITQNYTVISPAYGRDYKNKAQAESDFRKGKDFRLESLGHNGTYCSIKDFAPRVQVNIRYSEMRKVAVVVV